MIILCDGNMYKGEYQMVVCTPTTQHSTAREVRVTTDTSSSAHQLLPALHHIVKCLAVVLKDSFIVK